MMSDMKEQEQQLIEISIDAVQVNPYQPRREFADEELEELASSIRQVGLLQPPVVSPSVSSNDYYLISGERRLRAARLAGFERISVIVAKGSNQWTAEAALIENIQRVDLNPLELALALRSLMEEYGLSQDEVAKRVGKQRSTVANYLRLFQLPEEIQEGLVRGIIQMGHAKVLLGIRNREEQLALFKRVQEERLSVRQMELSATPKKVKKRVRRVFTPAENIQLRTIAEGLQRHLGTKVTLEPKGTEGGQLVIDYYGEEDLERLTGLIGLEKEVH